MQNLHCSHCKVPDAAITFNLLIIDTCKCLKTFESRGADSMHYMLHEQNKRHIYRNSFLLAHKKYFKMFKFDSFESIKKAIGIAYIFSC